MNSRVTARYRSYPDDPMISALIAEDWVQVPRVGDCITFQEDEVPLMEVTGIHWDDSHRDWVTIYVRPWNRPVGDFSG